MKWSELVTSPPPLSMTGLLTFAERWRPGSSADFRPATLEQMNMLAAPHGGLESLPPIYRSFLEVMGASTGELQLTWGTTSIVDLLEDLEDTEAPRADPERYLKFAIGEDDCNERQPDDFFDLSQPTPDQQDAGVLRIHESELVRGRHEPRRPFASFSDLVRSVTVAKLSLQVPKEPCAYVGFAANSMARVFELLVKLGFEYTELGASKDCVPLEHRGRGAVALLNGPSGTVHRVSLQLRTDEPKQLRLIQEIIADHKPDLEAG